MPFVAHSSAATASLAANMNYLNGACRARYFMVLCPYPARVVTDFAVRGGCCPGRCGSWRAAVQHVSDGGSNPQDLCGDAKGPLDIVQRIAAVFPIAHGLVAAVVERLFVDRNHLLLGLTRARARCLVADDPRSFALLIDLGRIAEKTSAVQCVS